LTPQDRSGKNVITPATANPSKSDAGRTSTRRSKRKSNDDDGSVDEDEVLVASNHLFTSRSSTCFKMGLDPTKDAHKKVICEGCMKVFENTPLGKFTKAIREAPRVAVQKMCHQPWHPKYAEHGERGKVVRYNDFNAIFKKQTQSEADDNNNDAKRQKTSSTSDEQQEDNPQQMNTEHEDTPQEANEQQEQDTPQVTQPLLEISGMFDSSGHFTNKSVKYIEQQLKPTYKDCIPNDNDKRVAGMLMTWVLQHSGEDVPQAELKSFRNCSQITVARVPKMYDVEVNARLTQARTKRCSEWLDTLMKGSFNIGSFNTDDAMLNLLMKKRKKTIPKQYLIKDWNTNYRFDTEATLAMMRHSNINPSQLERLAQFIDVETRDPGNNRGIRLFAPTKECYRKKKQYVKQKFTSMKFKRVKLSAVVASKKKGKEAITKSVYISVGTTDPLEIVMETMESNRKHGRFRSSDRRYNVPATWAGETALYKMGADAGAGSWKQVASPVNVDNPQGQEHVHPFTEYSGAKDDRDNLAKVYEEHPEMKRGIEDIIRRKVLYVEVKIGEQVGSCMVVNTDATHDYKNPKPLPDLDTDAVLSSEATSTRSDDDKAVPLDRYAVRVDFSRVKSTTLIRSHNQNCYEGLVFKDEQGERVGTSLFKTPIACTTTSDQDRHGCKMNQVLVMGVLASDLQLLCALFGHQGAASKWFCLFCLLQQSQSKDEFAGNAQEPTQRTLESIIADAQQYEEHVNNATEQEKAKSTFKSDVTQNCSHSITDKPLLDIPLDCITYASMHVVLGLTKWLVDLTIAGYKEIEKKAAVTDEGKRQVVFGETIELALKKARRYKVFLTEQLKDTEAVVTSQHIIAAKITALTEEWEEVRELNDQHFSPDANSELSQRELQIAELCQRELQIEEELEALRQQLSSESEAGTGDSSDIDHVKMILEQICITNESIRELEEYFNNHGSHSARVIDKVLKRNGVDQATYFKGAIVGNHCMTFAQKGNQIYSGILEELEPIIENASLKSELRDFTERMKAIVAVWYKVQRVIKSTEKQSIESINQFEENTNQLRILINKICKDDVPISGWKPRLTRSLKAHLLFGGHLLRQLRVWGTLGGIDEQNIESAHAIWNKLLRQFGATRGKELQMKVLSDYLFQTASFMHNGIAHVKKEMKRNLKSSAATRRTAPRREDGDDTIVEEEQCAGVTISDLASIINAEVALHPELYLTEEDQESSGAQPTKVSKEDTMIHMCTERNCEKLRLKLALDIHRYESHQILPVVGDSNAGPES